MNLATPYLGLRLTSPLVVGASPCCDDVPLAKQMEEAGAGAIVMRSLFEEQLEPPPRHTTLVARTRTEARETFPDFADYQLSPGQYLRQLDRLKHRLSIPVIASLNGHQPGAWAKFAPRLEEAGADAIELNFYQVVTDISIGADQVERDMLETVGTIAGRVRIPLAVKISPFHASVAQLAIALELAGAAGVVLFNRFYQPEVSIDDLEVRPQLHLSDPGELLLRLRWLAILSPEFRGSLIVTGGVHTAAGLIKALLAGAHAAQLVSVLLKDGPAALVTIRQGLESWMSGRGYTDLAQFRGLLNLSRVRDASAFERANYIRTLQSWDASPGA